MLTPPYHFSIVACPPVLSDIACGGSDDVLGGSRKEVLYRGSIPAVRNFPFLKRLKLKTVVYLQKKALKDEDPLRRWAKRHGVELVWVKADKMGEENLGMGRMEVGEVLKTILDPTAYPLYIADRDGISHATLIIACLRKLQGWHADSILDEITRFEPDYEDLPLVSFVTSYLTSGPSSDALILPSPPYPTWLWPGLTSTLQAPPLEKAGSIGGNSTLPSTGTTISRSGTISRDREPSAMKDRTDKEKDRDRDRGSSTSASTTTPQGPLPFPNPLTARKHPTMKLAFASPAQSVAPASQPSPTMASLSRVNSRRDVRSSTLSAAVEDGQSLVAAATSILSATLQNLGLSTEKDTNASNSPEGQSGRNAQIGSSSPGTDKISTQPEKIRITESGKVTRMVSFKKNRKDSVAVETEKRHAEQGAMESTQAGKADLDTATSRTVPHDKPAAITADAGTTLDRSSPGGRRMEEPGRMAPVYDRASHSPEPSNNSQGELDAKEVVVARAKIEPVKMESAKATEDQGQGEDGEEADIVAIEHEDEEYDDDDEDEEEEEEDDEDEDEDEDEDDDPDVEIPSLHISALDLAGYG